MTRLTDEHVRCYAEEGTDGYMSDVTNMAQELIQLRAEIVRLKEALDLGTSLVQMQTKNVIAENEKTAQRVKGLELRIEGKNGLLTAYRLGRQPSKAAFDKLRRAAEILGDEV